MTPVKRTVAEHPAETASPTVFVALTGLLTAFTNLNAAQAAAVSGAVAVVVPAVVTWYRVRRA